MYHCHRHREIHPFCTVILCIFTACFLTPTLQAAAPVELPGASIELVDYRGPATFSIRSPQKFRVEIDVMPHTERGPLTFRIELNQSGREAWPFQNVEVRDSAGRAIPVRRGGIE